MATTDFVYSRIQGEEGDRIAQPALNILDSATFVTLRPVRNFKSSTN